MEARIELKDGRKVLMKDYVEAKTKDLKNFGFNVTEDVISEALNAILIRSRTPHVQIKAFIEDDLAESNYETYIPTFTERQFIEFFAKIIDPETATIYHKETGNLISDKALENARKHNLIREGGKSHARLSGILCN